VICSDSSKGRPEIPLDVPCDPSHESCRMDNTTRYEIIGEGQYHVRPVGPLRQRQANVAPLCSLWAAPWARSAVLCGLPRGREEGVQRRLPPEPLSAVDAGGVERGAPGQCQEALEARWLIRQKPFLLTVRDGNYTPAIPKTT
jgi:hypothetical protein